MLWQVEGGGLAAAQPGLMGGLGVNREATESTGRLTSPSTMDLGWEGVNLLHPRGALLLFLGRVGRARGLVWV